MVSLAEDRVGVVVGDCVGRGLGAAAVMGQLRSACRALLLQPHRSPGQVLAALDDFAALIPDDVRTHTRTGSGGEYIVAVTGRMVHSTASTLDGTFPLPRNHEG